MKCRVSLTITMNLFGLWASVYPSGQDCPAVTFWVSSPNVDARYSSSGTMFLFLTELCLVQCPHVASCCPSFTGSVTPSFPGQDRVERPPRGYLGILGQRQSPFVFLCLSSAFLDLCPQVLFLSYFMVKNRTIKLVLFHSPKSISFHLLSP